MAATKLELLRVFVAVARTQSFTRAAIELGMDKSQLSRAIRALELELATSLFVRTTRSVRSTAEGEALFRRVAPALAELDLALSAVPDARSLPRGVVVVSTTSDLARTVLAPSLSSFRAQHPLVRVRVTIAAELVDLARDGVDLALRVGKPGGSSVVAKKLGELHAGFYASRGYLERRGAPEELADLARHEGLWPMPERGRHAFRPSEAPREPAIESSDFGLLAAVAQRDGGIALLPNHLARTEPALVRVLPKVELRGAPLYLVSRPLRPMPPRIAALRAHLAADVPTRLS